MCSTTVRQEYVQALQECVAAEKPFTAYDVTKRARVIANERVPHYGQDGVRNFVTSEYGNLIPATWNQTMVQLQSGQQALVYHPASVDPYDHPMADKNAASAQVPTPAPTVATSQDDDEDEDEPDSVVVKVTNERRVNIPRKMMKKVNPTGGSYDIFVNGDLVCRFPNKDGRLRVGKTELDKAGITDKAKISVDVKTNSILVHPSI